MEKRLNFNQEVDDLTKINEFFQNYSIPHEDELLRNTELVKIHIENEQ